MEKIEIKDGVLYLDKNFLSKSEADDYFDYFKSTANWQQQIAKFSTVEVPFPRLTAYYANPGLDYRYSGIIQVAAPWDDKILALKSKIDAAAGVTFNTLLLNYYRDGKDSIGWHSDSERELVPNPIVASLTLGATRNFELKHKKGAKVGRMTLPLEHGTLLVMGNTIQNYWLHAVMKTKEEVGERINLTFREML